MQLGLNNQRKEANKIPFIIVACSWNVFVPALESYLILDILTNLTEF